jgi:hypothetical protein
MGTLEKSFLKSNILGVKNPLFSVPVPGDLKHMNLTSLTKGTYKNITPKSRNFLKHLYEKNRFSGITFLGAFRH